jgi:hypothetical protein
MSITDPSTTVEMKIDAPINAPNTNGRSPFLSAEKAVKTSGAPFPMARKVIPAMDGESFNLSDIKYRGGTKK